MCDASEPAHSALVSRTSDPNKYTERLGSAWCLTEHHTMQTYGGVEDISTLSKVGTRWKVRVASRLSLCSSKEKTRTRWIVGWAARGGSLHALVNIISAHGGGYED